jgi:uncharacterized protein (TIGR02271 family)
LSGVCLALAAFVAPAAARAEAPAATAGPAPPVYVGGQQIDAPAFVAGRRTFVPVRGVFEAIGASVEFTPPRFIVVRKDHAVIAAFILDRRRAIIGHDAVDLDVAPTRRDGSVYVPLRVVAEAAGAAVTYSTAPQAIFITPSRSDPAGTTPADADPDASASASPDRFGRNSSKSQWRIGVAVFTALCCLSCLVLTARRFAPTLFRPAQRRAPERPPDEPPLPPQPPSDRVDLSSVEATGEALIRKRIVTETQTIEVPVTREELVIEYGGDGGTVIVEGRELAAGEIVRILLWEERVHVDVTKHTLLTHDVTVDKRRVTVPAPRVGAPPEPAAEPAAVAVREPDFAIAEGSPS